jgi:hypothetical protein
MRRELVEIIVVAVLGIIGADSYDLVVLLSLSPRESDNRTTVFLT